VRAAAVHPGGVQTELSRHMGADATQKLVDQINQRVAPRGQGSVSIQDHSARRGHFNMGRGMQIRMVAGFAEVIDREETLVATVRFELTTFGL
jgi:hypothetical protein